MALRVKISTKEAEKALKDLRGNLEAVGHSALENEKDMRKLENRMRKGLEAKVARRSVDELRDSMKLTRIETARLQREIGDYGGALKTLALGSGAAAKNLGTLAAAAGAAALYFTQDQVRDIVRVGTAYDSLTRSVKAVTGSTRKAALELEFIKQLAIDLGLPLNDLEKSYIGVLAASKGTALEGQSIQRVFKAIVTTGAVLGATGDQLQRVFLQIGQGIGRTRFELEDLKTIAEALPGVGIQDFAKALNVTTAEFFDMVSARQATVDVVLPAFANQLLDRFAPAAESAGDRAQAAFTGFDNSILKLKRSIAESGVMDFFADIARTGSVIADTMNVVISSDAPPKTSSKLEAQAHILDALVRNGWGKASESAKLYRQVSEDLKTEKLQEVADLIYKVGAAWRGARNEVTETVKVMSDIQLQEQQDKIDTALKGWFASVDAETKKLQDAATAQQNFLTKSRVSGIKESERIQAEAWRTEIETMNAAIDAERTAYEQFQDDYRQAIMTTTEYELAQLDKRYEHYLKTIDDKAKVDEWYDAQQKRILEDQDNEWDRMFDGWASSWSSTLNDMLWGADSTFEDIMISFGKMITQMIIQKQMADLMDWGSESGAFESIGSAFAGMIPSFDTGGTMTSSGRKKHFPAWVGEGEEVGYPDQLARKYGGSGGGVTITFGDINVTPTGDVAYDQQYARDIADTIESQVLSILTREKRQMGVLNT